jgi:hypothetical protein
MNASYGSLPFPEAIDFLKRKVNLPTKRHEDLMGAAHSRAFVVAGATKADLLTDLHGMVNQGIEGKITLADFRKGFDVAVKKHGWTYKGSRGWRTATIFQTNLSVAYAAGREQQRRDPAIMTEFPYDRYRTMDDGRVRAEHRSWNNTVLRADDPWWKTHTPPNGWGCRCWKEPVTGKERGTLVETGAKTTAPDNGTVDYTNPSTGEITQVPRGIDPGWDYNPGQAAWGHSVSKQVSDDWKASGEKTWERITSGDYKSNGRPTAIPLDMPVAALGLAAKSIEESAASLKRMLGGPEKIFSFQEGDFRHDMVIDADILARHIPLDRTPYLPLLTDLLTSPYEIWLCFEKNALTGKVALRERIIKGFQLHGGKAMIGVLQANKGRLESWTVIPTSDLKYANKQREGRLIWKRD